MYVLETKISKTIMYLPIMTSSQFNFLKNFGKKKAEY